MNILFVCSGNVFRSMSAEKLAKKCCKDNNLNLTIDSAGTSEHKNYPNKTTMDELKKYVGEFTHKSKHISQQLCDTASIIICMSPVHQRYIREHYNKASVLYNELATGKKVLVQDLDDAYPQTLFMSPLEQLPFFDKHVPVIVNNIHDTIPTVLKKEQEFSKYQ